jgi:SprT protein
MPAMTLIDPIDQAKQRQVIAEVGRYLAEGEAHFGRPFAPIPVLFDLKGTTSGMYRVAGKVRVIRFNPWIFAKHFDESLASTVPHEVAHYLTDVLYGLRNIRPHGEEWKRLMAVFGADASVRSTYSLEGIPRRRTRRYGYQCACQHHEISSQRHRRIESGAAQYRCRACGDTLRVAVDRP